jgi:phospholipid/cholesterol/gamma-HCH transport system ATP-binding protein
VIQLTGVSKSFGSRRVLRGIDLHISAGCLYGLIGPGASGKSLLLKLICGLLKPDAGSVVVDGRDIGRLDDAALGEHRRNIGMQFQNNALFDFMNVADNVAFPLRRLYQLSETAVTERVAERLARVALSGFEERLPSQLSGGQKKRIGIARATVTSPPIVLYDEPAAGLDPVTSQRIFDLLRLEQQARAATVIMVSSDIDRLLSVTDRLGMMHEGKLVFDGTTDEARSSEHPALRQFLRGLGEGPL